MSYRTISRGVWNCDVCGCEMGEPDDFYFEITEKGDVRPVYLELRFTQDKIDPVDVCRSCRAAAINKFAKFIAEYEVSQ